MKVKDLLKDLGTRFPKKSSMLNIDYSSLEMRVMKSICDKCPVCGEPIIDTTFFPDFSLKSHLAKQTDDAHMILEVMSL